MTHMEQVECEQIAKKVKDKLTLLYIGDRYDDYHSAIMDAMGFNQHDHY